MSYCRFSSDDCQCDVYVYEDCMGGWTTHVAGSRWVFKTPLPPKVDFFEDEKGWLEREIAIAEMLNDADRENIDLPHAGESFNDSSPSECVNRLESLRDLGYRVPQYAIDALREEAAQARFDQAIVRKLS